MNIQDPNVRHSAHSHHAVQLFDPGDSRAEALCAFVRDGLQRDQTVWLVMLPVHWADVAGAARAHGLDLDAPRQRGRLMVDNAGDMLDLFMRGGRPDARLFKESVAARACDVASQGNGLRVYGEMVDVLAGAGDFRSAQQLEALWNDLGADISFTLFCGYSAEHFGSVRAAGALQDICGLHSYVHIKPADVLSNYLLKASFT